jgi:hypothetical protein
VKCTLVVIRNLTSVRARIKRAADGRPFVLAQTIFLEGEQLALPNRTITRYKSLLEGEKISQ